MKAQYHTEYWDPKALSYRGGSQTANLLPILLNITPADCRTHAEAALLASFAAHGNATTSGIIGSSYFLDALHAIGRDDIALDVALRTEYPSWGHMVLTGPGTIWEAWNGATSSLNHPALAASIGTYLYRIAGLQPSTWQKGYMEFSPCRAAVARLGSAQVTVATGGGVASMSWAMTHSTFSLNASVPHNMGPARLHMHLPVAAQDRAGSCPVLCVRRRSPNGAWTSCETAPLRRNDTGLASRGPSKVCAGGDTVTFPPVGTADPIILYVSGGEHQVEVGCCS